MSRRRSLAVATVVLCPLLLTGCFVDRVPDAQQARSYSDGVMADAGDLRVVHALVVAGEDADAGVVSMTIANRGHESDRLVSIESDAGTVELPAPQDLPPQEAVALGAGEGPTPTIRGLTKKPGEQISLVLRFEKAEPVRLRTVVVPTEGEYATISPSPEESPEATPEETLSPSPDATESPTEAAS